MGVPLLVTVICQAPANAVPPLSFTTCLTTVSVAMVGVLSSLVMVQTFCSPSASVPEQPAALVLVYPATEASSTLYVPAPTVTSVPAALPGNDGSATPLLVTVMLKSAAFLVPPLSLTTVLITVRCAGWSSLVMVYVWVSSAAIVPVHSALVPAIQPAGPHDSATQ